MTRTATSWTCWRGITFCAGQMAVSEKPGAGVPVGAIGPQIQVHASGPVTSKKHFNAAEPLEKESSVEDVGFN